MYPTLKNVLTHDAGLVNILRGIVVERGLSNVTDRANMSSLCASLIRSKANRICRLPESE